MWEDETNDHRIIEMKGACKAMKSNPTPLLNAGIQIKTELTDGCLTVSWMAPVLKHWPLLKVMGSVVILF